MGAERFLSEHPWETGRSNRERTAAGTAGESPKVYCGFSPIIPSSSRSPHGTR